ncbi:MAG: hypothetical protein LBJ74_00315, partial [Heliobacteriaceae bacterium]|nr:hypothetical protein [Heliobacteriaceae bacterium]
MVRISGKMIRAAAVAIGVIGTTAAVKKIDTKSIFAGSSKSETAAQRDGRLSSEKTGFQKEIVDAWNDEHSYALGLVKRYQKNDIKNIPSEDTWRL